MNVVSGLAACSLYGVGLGASVDDMRRRKVANQWVAAALAVSALSFAYLGLCTALGRRHVVFLGLGEWYMPASFFGYAAEHFVLSCAAAVGLWYMRIWPAGDAKLFIGLSSLLILADFNLRGFPGWLFLVTLINIFVAAGIYVTGVVLWEWAAIARRWSRAGRHELGALADRLRRRLLDEWAKRRNYARLGWNTVVFFLVFGTVLNLLSLRLRGATAYLGVYLALYLAWRWLRGVLVRRSVAQASFFIMAFVVAPLAAWFRWDLLDSFLKSLRMTVGFDAFLLSFRRIVDWYLRSARRRSLPRAELREGMVLSDESWGRLGHAELDRYADGLSGDEARFLGAEAVGEVEVYWHRPFALWIFLGCLWTLYSRQTVVQWLMTLARR